MKKFRKLSLEELRVRGTQKISAFAERSGWSKLSRMPGDEIFGPSFESDPRNFLEHFRTREHPQFFKAFQDKEKTVSSFRTHWTEHVLLEQADRICEGRFDLLGLEQLDFGNQVDWHLEPQSGKRSALVHWSRVEELDAEESGDKKIVWEVNRQQHFVLLGQAYWLTNDERYAAAFVSHLTSWIEQNPPKLGINWISGLEIAFRSISWIWGLYFFKNSSVVTPELFVRACKILYINARHLESYLSTYFSPNTHLTGEALGLYYLGTVFPEFAEARRWRARGKQILLEQLPLHVKDDGVYFEQSTYYHRYTADFYTHFLLLSRLQKDTLPQEVEKKLQALLDHLMYITRPDGAMPLLGDDDGGRLMMFDSEPKNESRSSLAAGAVLFGRSDYKFVAGSPFSIVLWMFGPEGISEWERLNAREPANQSVAFPAGGYYVMRDGWTSKANYLLFDCGPHGVMNCGHAHADALSFELAANGRSFLIDPGTFGYTGSKELRNWFRSSAAHNTLTIDGESSSVTAGPFSWNSIANVECTSWIVRERFNFVSGQHDGYRRFASAVVHARSVLFLKNDYWVVGDEVETHGMHSADLYFHFDSNTNPLIEAGDGAEIAVSERSGDRGLDLMVFGKKGRWRREEGWVSRCYGKREPARTYVYSAENRGKRQFVTFLLPRTTTKHFAVREVEAIGGKAFEVEHENGVDVVMIRAAASAHVEMERMASDFRWTWARFALEDDAPSELVVMDGSSLSIKGEQVLKSSNTVRHLSAKRSGIQFLIDTEEVNFGCELQIANFESFFVDAKSKG